MANFFRLQKPKGFHIEPRFWDPIKEEREKRDRRIKAELGLQEEGEGYRPYIGKGAFRQGMSKGRWSPHKQKRATNTRLIIIAALLAAAIYFMLK
jgi:hypothetical protein